MKIKVVSRCTASSFWCFAGNSDKPTHILHFILPQLPAGMYARYAGSTWTSVKRLAEDAQGNGFSLYKLGK